jgi:predicted metal-dependent hydrolase
MMSVWPPPYQIKRHKRARRVKLGVKHRELKITVPYWFNVEKIPAILEANKAWVAQQILALPAQQTEILPSHIMIRAMNESWTVCYVPSLTRLKIIPRSHYLELVLMGDIQNKNLLKKMLINWLKNKARLYLTTQLQIIGNKMRLQPRRITIRDQRTRWGSCTENKTINLNYKLIFLPSPLVAYVLLHELCHLIYLDHSAKFWCLVAIYDPDWQMHRYALRQANQFIPAWL